MHASVHSFFGELDGKCLTISAAYSSINWRHFGLNFFGKSRQICLTQFSTSCWVVLLFNVSSILATTIWQRRHGGLSAFDGTISTTFGSSKIQKPRAIQTSLGVTSLIIKSTIKSEFFSIAVLHFCFRWAPGKSAHASSKTFLMWSYKCKRIQYMFPMERYDINNKQSHKP